MKKINFFRTIKKILIVIILLGLSSAGIDLIRMNNNKLPIFNLKKYDPNNKIQIFRGIFYQAKRTIKASPKESLIDSKDIKFTFIIFNIKTSQNFETEEIDYNIETTETTNCTENAKLYYADEKIKVYTYCLEKINIINKNKKEELIDYLKKDNQIIDEIDSRLTYLGLYSDLSTLMFQSPDNYSNNGLKMYRCNKKNINDVYIGPKDLEFQADFCTYKDDDLKFMFKIQTEQSNTNSRKEVIYEDEDYRYELIDTSSDNVFIIKPAVRGKEEKKIPLKTIISSQLLTLDDLANKGLKFNKIDKSKETRISN